MQDRHPETLLPLARQVDVVVRTHELGATARILVELPAGRHFTTDELNSLERALLSFVEGLCKTS